jgi:hypothetical protein
MAVRRIVRSVAFAWLVCQLVAIAAAPLSLCCAEMPAADHHQEKRCCPGLLPGQVCPMHHTRAGDKTCAMRSACGRIDPALVSLVAGLGVLPHLTTALVAFEPLAPIAAIAASPMARADRPDLPPPRA